MKVLKPRHNDGTTIGCNNADAVNVSFIDRIEFVKENIVMAVMKCDRKKFVVDVFRRWLDDGHQGNGCNHGNGDDDNDSIHFMRPRLSTLNAEVTVFDETFWRAMNHIPLFVSSADMLRAQIADFSFQWQQPMVKFLKLLFTALFRSGGGEDIDRLLRCIKVMAGIRWNVAVLCVILVVLAKVARIERGKHSQSLFQGGELALTELVIANVRYMTSYDKRLAFSAVCDIVHGEVVSDFVDRLLMKTDRVHALWNGGEIKFRGAVSECILTSFVNRSGEKSAVSVDELIDAWMEDETLMRSCLSAILDSPGFNSDGFAKILENEKLAQAVLECVVSECTDSKTIGNITKLLLDLSPDCLIDWLCFKPSKFSQPHVLQQDQMSLFAWQLTTLNELNLASDSSIYQHLILKAHPALVRFRLCEKLILAMGNTVGLSKLLHICRLLCEDAVQIHTMSSRGDLQLGKPLHIRCLRSLQFVTMIIAKYTLTSSSLTNEEASLFGKTGALFSLSDLLLQVLSFNPQLSLRVLAENLLCNLVIHLIGADSNFELLEAVFDGVRNETMQTSAVAIISKVLCRHYSVEDAASEEEMIRSCWGAVTMKFVNVLIPLCMANYFLTRLYAQAALCRLHRLTSATAHLDCQTVALISTCFSTIYSDSDVGSEPTGSRNTQKQLSVILRSNHHLNSMSADELRNGLTFDDYLAAPTIDCSDGYAEEGDLDTRILTATAFLVWSYIPCVVGSISHTELMPTTLTQRTAADKTISTYADVYNRLFSQSDMMKVHPALRGSVVTQRDVDDDDIDVYASGVLASTLEEAFVGAHGGRFAQRKVTDASAGTGAAQGGTKLPSNEQVDSVTDESSGVQGGLIVVASHVEKGPNLGGICRTCEVFKVSAMTVHDVQATLTDKEFQSLSMTSEKWQRLLEVSRDDAVLYLLEMKRRGFRVVALEQSSNSTGLSRYEWRRDTVLVLGHERRGVDAATLALVDDCVEIEQCGVIRSLNVHVSAALAIYSYRSQVPPPHL